MLMAIFHLSVFLLNLFTFWYDHKYIDIPFPDPLLEKTLFKGRTALLTFWCFVVQTTYFGVALLNDIIGTNAISPKKTPMIRKTKDILFTLAFPVGIYVSATFWGIYHVDKELIFPDAMEKILPIWMNHVLHTLVSVFITLELVAFFRNYPTRKTGLFMVVLFNCAYIVLISVLYVHYDVWIYPILSVLNWPLRIAFFAMGVIVSTVLYVLGEKINNTVWSKQLRNANKKVKH